MPVAVAAGYGILGVKLGRCTTVFIKNYESHKISHPPEIILGS